MMEDELRRADERVKNAESRVWLQKYLWFQQKNIFGFELENIFGFKLKIIFDFNSWCEFLESSSREILS